MEKKSVGLLELETAVLECFSEKTPLSPLGVNLRGWRSPNSNLDLGSRSIFWSLNHYSKLLVVKKLKANLEV
jgi:hypothetical protein